MRWVQIREKQYDTEKKIFCLWCICYSILLLLWTVTKEMYYFWGMVAMFGIGVTSIATILHKKCRIRKISNLMNYFIRKNGMYQSHSAVKGGLIWEKEVEVMDYYPQVEYAESKEKNTFYIRFRLDGSAISQKFKDIEQALAEMFMTVCTDIIHERGYITYCFELQEQEQVKIASMDDTLPAGENEIAFSESVIWNWKKVPHLLLTGMTGSGKTLTAYYIISCLMKQGGRVIYLDPKNDDEMRRYMKNLCVTYVTKENDIAKMVRETEEELRLREQELDNIGIKEAEFTPIFLFFDEMLAFSKIADKKTYEETMKRFSSIVVMGRSKRVYACALLQRGDSEFLGGGSIRDNFGCRICMGQASSKAYEMVFGPEFSHVKNYRKEIGSGLIYRQGVDSKPREFLAPFICKGEMNRE